MDFKSHEPQLRAGLDDLQLRLSDVQVGKLLDYLALLHQWNRAYNLTAISDPSEMVAAHLLDSLAIAPYLKGKSYIDVGTGPGLPGIPLALACPDKTFTLLDSNGKRTRFLFQVKTSLGLSNIQEVHSRAEDFKPEKPFDGVISRAFTSLDDMVSKTASLLIPEGEFLAMKGRLPEKELSELPKPYNVCDCYRLDVPGVEGERHLVVITAPSQSPG